jgi:hypothetical protein
LLESEKQPLDLEVDFFFLVFFFFVVFFAFFLDVFFFVVFFLLLADTVVTAGSLVCVKATPPAIENVNTSAKKNVDNNFFIDFLLPY